ncbi:hypothetical protein CR159_04350 [Pollutimonas subterranea]|uniref:Uncharacterized protein n=1 Tax=Pollutimonas subterranea TaxID=2045210 RepID=A0A2N4U7W0_9BURK|nr:hypothetical protein CR159_04350 [Pollutimonas subterranea]
MLSGVRLSCYQEYEVAAKPIRTLVCGRSNLGNFTTLTFRRAPFRWISAQKHKALPRQQQKNLQKQPQNQPRSAEQKQASFPDRRATS